MSSVPTPANPFHRSCRIRFMDTEARIEMWINVKYKVMPDDLHKIYDLAIDGVFRIRLFDRWDDVAGKPIGQMKVQHPWSMTGRESETHARVLRSMFSRDDVFARWLHSEVAAKDSGA